MTFMERIRESECGFKKYVKDNGQPLIIVGSGIYAKIIISYLKNKGINNFHVCVDENYWSPGMQVEECEVNNLNDVLKNSKESFDIIIGYYTYHRADLNKYMQYYPNAVNNILYWDMFPLFCMKPQIYCVDRSFYENNDDALTWLYDNLADDDSRKVLISFIEQRISGDFNYSEGVLSNIEKEYFNSDLINFDDKMTLVDCGAYDGQDTKDFFNKYNGMENIYSFVVEPDKDNLDLINKNLSDYKNCIRIINKALWNDETTLSFCSGGGEGSGLNNDGETTVESISLNKLYDLYPECFEEKTTMIKIDIEGSELKALEGGAVL